MAEADIVQMLMSGQDDLKWFDSNLKSLIHRYNNKFIAFGNKTIIESDSDLDTLMNKLEQRSIDTSAIFIKFVSDIKFIL